MVASTVALLVFVSGVAALSPLYGAMGAAGAMSLAVLVYVLVIGWLLRVELGWEWTLLLASSMTGGAILLLMGVRL
jgi:hypothetical protein